jgi:uroporphyrinogen decarboxylase
MTPKQRVINALHHEQADNVPYNIGWENGVRDAFIEWCGDPSFDRHVVNHLIHAGVDAKRTDESEKGWIDEWGCPFQQGNIFHITDIRLPEPQLGDLRFPDLTEEWRYAGLDQCIRDYPDRFIMTVYYSCFFERGWMLRGMENWLMDLATDDPFVVDLMDGMLEMLLGFVDTVGRRSGLDSIWIGDDFGQQRGLIMGPKIWRKHIKPRLAQVFDRIHQHGKYTGLHSCGDNTEIMEDLVEIGLDIFNPFQPEAMDIVEMKQKYGDRITFNGGIGTQGTLVYGSPEDVRREVRSVIREIGKDGGLIIETTKALRPEVPKENIVALIDELVNQG